MLELIHVANLALRFLLELCALAALGYWGLETGRGPIANIGLGICTPLAAAAIWATLVPFVHAGYPAYQVSKGEDYRYAFVADLIEGR